MLALRFVLVGCLVVLAPILSRAASASRPAGSKPNFVVIMVDDMGYAGLSCFGNPYFKTPHIDRLAGEGILLTDFHSSGTVCSPTRAGLVTGRYQQRTGIEAVIHPAPNHAEHRKGLQASEITFAERLKEVGYTTGLVGKWHLGYPHNTPDYHPQNHGFDEFIGYHSGNIDFVSHVGDHNIHDWWHGRKEVVEEGYATDLINRHAVEFIERHHSRPFCLYIPHLAIHNPVQVRGDPVRRPVLAEAETEWKPRGVAWKPASEAERIEKYRGMTLPIDDGVGQILETLVRLRIEKDTVILFFTDNGAANDFPSGSPHLRGAKGSVYEGGHKVPFIAWWPGRIPAGKVSDTAALTIDVMPTLLSLAGVAPRAGNKLDGVDLSPVLLQGKSLPPRPLFWSSMGNNGNRSEAYRDGSWKLVVQHPNAAPGTFDFPKFELYHLGQDPTEKDNIAERESKRVQQMNERLQAWLAEVNSSATPQPGGWLQPSRRNP